MSVERQAPAQEGESTNRPASAAPAQGGLARQAKRACLALVLLVLCIHWAVEMHAARLQDLDVYLAASRDILAGRDPYAPRAALPYTYPPVWAVLCVPLALLPVWLAKTLVFTGSLAIAVLLVRRLAAGLSRPWLWAGAAMFAAPISRTLYQGQVNLLIVALVLMDFFVVSPRARGIGIGVSGAIKLTPAFMALPLLLRKDWAGLTRAVGTFVALSLATFVLWPGPSREYFTQLLFDSGRVGGVAYADNQSLLGAVARFVGPDTAGRVLVVLLVPVLALTAWAVLRQVRAQNVLGQVAAAGLGASLISPVSWSHHWVWLVLASALIARVGHERLAVLMLLPLVFEPGWVASRLPPQLPQLAVASVLALTPVVAIVCLWSLGRAEPRTTDGQ